MSSQTPKNQAADESDDEAPKLQIKVPQLVGAACASVLTAVLGSRLGIAGTLIGAAVSSVVFSLFSPFVSFSIERSHHHLKARRQRADEPSDAEASETAVSDLASDAAASGPAPEDAPAKRRTGSHAITRRVGVGLATLGTLVGAVVTFLLSMGILTVAESTTGRSVDGKYGTTVSGVVAPHATKTPDAPASTSADEEATPTSSSHRTPAASASATTTPTLSEASAEPTRTPSPSSTPVASSVRPSATPTPTQTADPATADPTPSPSVTATVRSASTPEPTASVAPRS